MVVCLFRVLICWYLLPCDTLVCSLCVSVDVVIFVWFGLWFVVVGCCGFACFLRLVVGHSLI